MNAPMTENEGLVMVAAMVVIILMPLVMEWVMVRWERRVARVAREENRKNN